MERRKFSIKKTLSQGEFERGVSEESLILSQHSHRDIVETNSQHLQAPTKPVKTIPTLITNTPPTKRPTTSILSSVASSVTDKENVSEEYEEGSPPIIITTNEGNWLYSNTNPNTNKVIATATIPKQEDEIIRLNIGGQLFMTTKTTLFSRGDNFFSTLVSGKLNSIKDDNGAYYIDRNGRSFEPILDYLRNGELIIPRNIKVSTVVNEAIYYSINIIPGLCGRLKEGLYTSSHWIIFLERDIHHPWIFGVTGIEDGFSKESKNVFFKQVCKVKENRLHWNYNGTNYQIFITGDKVYIWNPKKYDSYTQLYFRCPSSTQFPLDILETLTSDKGKDHSLLTISFKSNANKEIFAKTSIVNNVTTTFTSPPPISYFSIVEVLCRRLLIIHSSEKEDQGDHKQWILYIHSELAFFAFGHSSLEFGASLRKPTTILGANKI